MQKFRGWLALAATGCTLLAGITARSAQPHLTESALLSAVYDTILDARFDEARQALQRACPPAPAAACETLRAVATWWQIQQNPGDRSLDQRLRDESARALASARAWTSREPRRAEAWFYLAGAHGPLSQWRVLRGERLAAARDGKSIKEALERALELDRDLQDAYFGIGLYHYYADVAPAALKILRFLLLLPGGDRAAGLREMLRARDGGELLRGEADYQLHWIYVWYEEQPEPALALLRRLDARHPSNPLFLHRIAEMQHENFSDHGAAAASWRDLLARALAGRVAAPAMSAARARVGLAEEVLHEGDARRALALLDEVGRSSPGAPYGIGARVELVTGDAYAQLGDRTRAASAYRRALERVPADDPDRIRARVREARSRLDTR